MKFETACYGCLLDQADKLVSGMNLEWEDTIGIMKEILRLTASMDPELPAPNYGREIHNLIKKRTGNSDPYAQHKEKSNDMALAMVPEIERIITISQDPLKKALQVSISGNIIDYGAPVSCESADIRRSLENALDTPLDESALESFRKDLYSSRRVLFIGDNAGEIVFDRFLLERMKDKAITFAVRGEAILNDATREDAKVAGIGGYAQVIDTGDSTPGIVPARSSKEFLTALKEADLVILKGQGNFETLYGEDLTGYGVSGTPFYFLFKVKCRPVSRITGLPVGSIAFLRKAL